MREVERLGRYTDESANTPATIAAVSVDVCPPEQDLREFYHDLRQPLAAIRALATAATVEPGVSLAVQRWIDQIADEVACGCQFID